MKKRYESEANQAIQVANRRFQCARRSAASPGVAVGVVGVAEHEGRGHA